MNAVFYCGNCGGCRPYLLLLLCSMPAQIFGAVTCASITQEPDSVVTYFCDFVTFHVEATGTLPLRYHWYRNGSAIANATNSTYVTPRPAAIYSGRYFVTVENDGCLAVTSRVVNLITLLDTVPPSVRRALVLPDRSHILLSFYPCPMDPGTALEPTNYEISGGITISNVTIVQETNLLLTTSLLAPATHYILRLSHLRNAEGNTIHPDPTEVSLWVPPLRLSVLSSNDAAYLTWPAGGILQRSLSVTGIWVDVTAPTGFFILSNGPAGFYRVRFPGW